MKKLEYNTITISCIFRTLRSASNKNETYKNQIGSIYFRMKMDAQSPIEINSKVKSVRRNWDSIGGRLKGRDELSRQLNETLNSLEVRLRNIYTSFLMKDEEVNLTKIKEFISGEFYNKNELIDGFNQMRERMVNVAVSTRSHYSTTADYLRKFILYKYKVDKYPIAKIDFGFVDDLNHWLLVKTKCNDVGAGKHHFRLNKFLENARKKDQIVKNPYEIFPIVKSKPSMKYLDAEELKKIEEVDLSDNKRLEKVRDNFVFGCYSGLCHIELRTLTRDCISNKKMEGKRTKSKISFTVPLLDTTKKLMDKYKSHPDVINKNFLVPTMTNQRTNIYLKEIKKMCGITKNLTFHMSRHTFATTIYIANGGSTDALKGILGHADIKTTQIYGKVGKERIGLEMDMINKKLNNK